MLTNELILMSLKDGLDLCKINNYIVKEVRYTFSPREKDEKLSYSQTEYKIVRVKKLEDRKIEIVVARPFNK